MAPAGKVSRSHTACAPARFGCGAGRQVAGLDTLTNSGCVGEGTDARGRRGLPVGHPPPCPKYCRYGEVNVSEVIGGRVILIVSDPDTLGVCAVSVAVRLNDVAVPRGTAAMLNPVVSAVIVSSDAAAHVILAGGIGFPF